MTTSFRFYERGFSGRGSLREKRLELVRSQGWPGKGKQYLSGSVSFCCITSYPQSSSINQQLRYKFVILWVGNQGRARWKRCHLSIMFGASAGVAQRLKMAGPIYFECWFFSMCYLLGLEFPRMAFLPICVAPGWDGITPSLH